MSIRPIVIAGPTGSGKSRLAVRLAHQTDGEIVNFDSLQVYRGFDIGTAKPTPAEREGVPHHLFDVVDPDQPFNAAEFGRMARSTCSAIAQRGRRPILTGGTFFYLRAFLSELPQMPERNEPLRRRIAAIATRPRGPQRLHAWLGRVDALSAGRIAPADRRRVERALEVWITSGRPISAWDRPGAAADEIETIKIGLRLERTLLHATIDARVRRMYADGLVEETRRLAARYGPDSRPFGAIGYREALAVLSGSMTAEAAIEETARRTRAYAKRQMTWLRSERNLHWIDAADRDMTLPAALRLIEEHS